MTDVTVKHSKNLIILNSNVKMGRIGCKKDKSIFSFLFLVNWQIVFDPEAGGGKEGLSLIANQTSGKIDLPAEKNLLLNNRFMLCKRNL